jgi:putative tryptophan/tyrosine transport system substrate-binding protein
VPAFRIVEALDVVEYISSRLVSGAVRFAPYALGLQRREEALHRCIVPDVAPAFAAFKGRVDALYVVASPLVNVNRIRINTFALAARLPTIYGTRENVEVGDLMSYGPNFLDLFRRSADIVDKILRGAKPGDIPVEQPDPI